MIKSKTLIVKAIREIFSLRKLDDKSDFAGNRITENFIFDNEASFSLSTEQWQISEFSTSRFFLSLKKEIFIIWLSTGTFKAP